MYLGNSDVIRIYQGLNMIYGQSAPVEPCFEVVNLISSASGDYIDVYELSTSKWYKKNNLNAYEEYGVMETVQNIQNATYYTGKLVILSTDNHEYKWNGNAWSDLGNAGDIKTYTFLDGGESDEYEIPFDYYWGNGYKMEILCKRTSTVSGDKRLIGGEGTTPIIFSFYNNGFYFDRHNPTSTTSNACVSGSFSNRILNSSGLSNYLNDYLKIEIELDKVKFTCGDNTTTSGSTTYTTTWYDGLYRASIVAQKSNNYSICSIKIYNDQGNVIHDIEPKVNPDGQYLVTLYDKILDAEYNPTRATSTPVYHYEYVESIVPVEDYQTKVAPVNNVHYDTLEELELMECPWIGMKATIGEENVPYKYTEDGWELGYIIYGTTTGTADMYVGSRGRNTYSSSSNGIHLHVKDGKFYAEESDVVGSIGAFYYNESGFCVTPRKLITSIDIWTYPNTNVTDMGSMFEECSGLTSVNLSQFNTSNVTSMDRMFYKCTSLTSLDLSNFNTAKLTNMSWFIRQCPNLTYVNLSSFDTTNVTTMEALFNDCPAINKLILGPGFFNSTKLSTFNLSPLSAWTDAESLETMVQALESNPKSKTISLSTNTKNALTQAQKDRIAAAGWTIG